MATVETENKHAIKAKIEDVFSTETFGKNYGTCKGFVKTKKINVRTGQKVGQPRHYFVTGDRQDGHDDCGNGDEWSEWEDFEICLGANGNFKVVDMEKCNFIRGIRDPPCNKDTLHGSQITEMFIRATQFKSSIELRDEDNCKYEMEISEFNPILNDLEFNVVVPKTRQHLKIKPIKGIDIVF